MKKEVEEREKALERNLISAEVTILKKNLEDDERKAVEDKRKSKHQRQRELANQISEMPPRVPR
jgi:hypothetical protein